MTSLPSKGIMPMGQEIHLYIALSPSQRLAREGREKHRILKPEF